MKKLCSFPDKIKQIQNEMPAFMDTVQYLEDTNINSSLLMFRPLLLVEILGIFYLMSAMDPSLFYGHRPSGKS